MQTAIITGGSSGIGKAIAELFATKGYKVYELSRRDESVFENENIEHLKCDVCNEQQTKDTVAYIYEKEKQIDVLISNAGFGISGAIEFTRIEDAKRQFDVNFFGALTATQAVLPYMREQKRGKIIFTSSVAAVLSIPYQSFYSASKAAINSLCLALRNEVRDFNISVSCMMPGDVKTGFTSARDKSAEGAEVYTHLDSAIKAMEHDEQNGMTAESIARKVYRISKKRNPKPLYTTGLQYHIFVALQKLLPNRFSNWVVGLIYK